METISRYPNLPPEILDYIVDLLHKNPEALHRCCLVSKSWVPRTRKHLFANIKFGSDDNLNSWKRNFPDPMNSPAHHARTLTVECNPGDPEESSWIQGFSRVERLVVDSTWVTLDIACILRLPFHTLAPSLKSIIVVSLLLPSQQIFDLIRSLLALEDLTLICDNVLHANVLNRPPVVPSVSPALTGTLDLFVFDGLARVLRPLLCLPGGLRFRRLELAWCGKPDLPWVTELMTACSDTLEYLDIGCEVYGEFDLVSSLSRPFTRIPIRR